MIRLARLLTGLLAALAALPGVAQAETHGLPIRNGSGESVTAVYMSAPGSAGAGSNRLRSNLPPGAEGTFTYSTGCRADVRLAYANGRSEDHRDVDICGGSRVIAGQDGVVGPAVTPTAGAPVGTSRATGGKPSPTGPGTVALAPPAVVPPWTGRSITKRFGGLD